MNIIKRRCPTPRPEVFDMYWRFASERQEIFLKRIKGQAFPWSNDPILQQYKFCNVYRAADRVSQYLIRDVAYHQDQIEPVDRLFQIMAFRIFSRISTWQGLKNELGDAPTIKNIWDGSLVAAIENVKNENGRLYTGAFILCANNAYNQKSKHLNHIELFRHMFVKNSLGEKFLSACSLKEVYNLIHAYPLMGDFMSYQIAIDLNYSDLLEFNENDFTKPGPGALRGLGKVFQSLGDFSPEDTISWMVDRQKTEFTRLELPFDGLWGRSLHAIDCQSLFCEVDKYCRKALPDLQSARKRIKTRFSPTRHPIQFYFPPKWGINDKIPTQPLLGYEENVSNSLKLQFSDTSLSSAL